MRNLFSVLFEIIEDSTQRISQTFSKTLEKIPVPPLAEQERIVAKLDALFSRIDQAIAQLQHTQSQTKALFASALDQSFQKNKDRERIGDFCLVKGGKRLKMNKVKALRRRNGISLYSSR